MPMEISVTRNPSPVPDDRLAEILAARGRHDELGQLYTAQAGEVEQQGDATRAADLWARAAQILEEPLGDIDGALKAHRRVVTLVPSIASLDALARLHLSRNEPGVAAEWLQRRHEASAEEERTPVALRLADAHLAAGNREQATRVFERVLAADPSASEARARLADLYRADEAWEPLAKLLAEGAPHEQDEATRLAYGTDEAVEGRDSFLEKRDPDWSPYPWHY